MLDLAARGHEPAAANKLLKVLEEPRPNRSSCW